MHPESKNSAPKPAFALTLGVLAGALALTVLGAILAVALWRSLPTSQIAAASPEFRARRDAVVRRLAGDAREGGILWAAATGLAPQFSPRGGEPRSSAKDLQDAMSLRSTQVGRLFVAASARARLDAEGRSGEQAWAVVRPYLDGLENAKFGHFYAPLQAAWTEIYGAPPVREGTALQATSEAIGQFGEAFTPFLQFFVPRLSAFASERAAAGDPAGADLCRKIARRLLRDWTLEPGRVGTRLVAADLLARELEAEPANAKIVEGLRAWRKAYRDSAKQLSVPVLGVGGDQPDLCPTQHAGMVGAVASSLWLAIATAIAGFAGLAVAWALLRDSAVLRDWRTLAVGGTVAIGVCLSAGLVIRGAGSAVRDDLRGMMARAAVPKTAKLTRADTWHPAYRARIPWAAAAWTVGVVVSGALAGALSFKSQRLSAAAGALAVGWLLVAAAWTVQSAWGLARVGRYESALADAYRKGVYAAVVGEYAEIELNPLRGWQP